MSFDKLILLAPCHGLEDFPLYHTGDDAGSLLACWTALWHPAFIKDASSLPRVERCDYPPEDIDNALLVVPAPCESELDPDLGERAERQNAKLIHGQLSRSEVIREGLSHLDVAKPDLDNELVRDFLAFGFAFFQVEVLTQQMRYGSSIEQSRVLRELKAAAEALFAADHETCREKLTACHDALADERNHYYPVEVYLLDLTMLAMSDATLGASLDRHLALNVAQNFLASGQVVERLAEKNEAAVNSLRGKLLNGTASIAGGEYEELQIQLHSFDSIVGQLEKGDKAYKQHLGEGAHCFARRKHGMFPSLPYALRRSGFQSALHLKFDEGKMPEASQGKTNWQVANEDVIECFARMPLDASLHETFLNLPASLSDTMDTDHVAARIFVHWPGHATPWYGDLLRCARYGTALGQFVTLREFFSESTSMGTRDSFSGDDYVYPTLMQSVANGDTFPISKWQEYWRREITQELEHGLATLHHCHDFGAALDKVTGSSVTVLNPTSFARRIKLQTDHDQATGKTVYASAKQHDGSLATLVDVPAMGFATVQFAGESTLDGPDLAEELTLKNEFFQATIDRETGALRAIKDYKPRSMTRLSQQVAFRITLPKTGQPWVDRQAPTGYSVMAADSVETTHNGKVFAEIKATGRMLALNGEQLGTFIQRYQVTRGSRVLVIETDITTEPEMFLDDPWDSYYAMRFAFGDESALLRAGTRMQVHDVSRSRFEAPLFVDIDCANSRTTILTGGLPFHRRVNLSQLDTLISVKGEQATTSRVGIGIDLPSPARSAIDFLASSQPATLVSPIDAESGWFFHVDAKNVVIPWWRVDEDGRVRLRVVETEGRRSAARLSCYRPVKGAIQIGETQDEGLPIEDGVVQLSVKPQSFTELLLEF